MTVCLDLWVRREIDVFSPQAWGPWHSRIRRASCKVHSQCISKVKKPWSSTVTLATAMPTVVINSRVVLIVPLICHDERVYKQIILCKTSLSIKVNCFFLHKITALVQNLLKATINPSTKKKLNLWDFSLPLAFSFTLHTSTKPTDASASKIIALKMQPSKKIWKPMKYIRRHIKSNKQLLLFLSKTP